MVMEKQLISEGEAEILLRTRRQPKAVLLSFPKLFIAFFLAASIIWHFEGTLIPWNRHRGPERPGLKPFDWNDISAKPYLDYAPCYDNEYQCARLELPMDYWNSTTNATISLAIIKKPAAVPVTHPQYGGPILLNPGGPGGSGIGFLQVYCEHIQDVLEGHDLDEKHFDLISFDPRGIGQTQPSVRCHEDPVFDEGWFLRLSEEGVFSSSDAAFSRVWSLYQLRGGLCSLPGTDRTPDIKKYVSTASVARDMLEIVEKHGEWREKEAKRLLDQHKSCRTLESTVAAETAVDLLESLKHTPGKEKINYLGFSYGSYLGNTFAAMYPDRINRLVVDGVVDAYDYTKSLWFDNLVDTEKDMDLFYYHCARVGYPRCAMANETGETTEEGVKERALNVIASLYHNPLAVILPAPEMVTYSDIKDLIVVALYSPLQMFPWIAEILAELERGVGTTIALGQMHRIDCSSCLCPDSNSALAQSYDAGLAISCGDGDDQTSVTKAEFKEHIDNLSKLSPTIGEIWAHLRLRCIHYDVRPIHRFPGPWVGNTSHPILQVGNTADPVTPGRYAKKMAEGFPGAVALIQDSAGHCSVAAPSNCTEAYVRRYFQTGKLPEPGTVCEADMMPFGPDPGANEVMDVETMKRKQRAADFAKAMYASRGGLTGGQRFQRMPWMF